MEHAIIKGRGQATDEPQSGYCIESWILEIALQ